jgi:hypothetical protein
VLVVNFDGFFAFTYSSQLLWSWPLGRTWYHHTSLSFALYLKGCQFCPAFFLERESWSWSYQEFFYCLPAWSYPQVFNSGLGMRLCEVRFDKELFSCRNFWNFKAIPDTKNILTSIQSKLILKKFKWFLLRGFQKWWKLFCFAFGEQCEVMLGWSKNGSNFNLRVTENRFSKHLFYLHK